MAVLNPASSQQGVVILGSTGSIGTSTLSVIEALPERFRVVGLCAANNRNELQRQVHAFEPDYAYLENGQPLDGTRNLLEPDALMRLATLEQADIVVVATTGHTAIEPTLAALKAGKIVALANKETIVAAGELVMHEVKTGPGVLRTIDSEHSALWQSLGADQVDHSQVRKLILTGSGGPFRGRSRASLSGVTLDDALKHPNFAMGAKITIDSATLMNKGLEIIEARWLFDCPFDAIDVVIHPEQIVHSLVEFTDGAMIAQLGSHDMRLPIQYALTYPERVAGPADRIDLLSLSCLSFEQPDVEAFPLLSIAREAGKRGSTYPAVLSAADSIAVQAFLDRRISFLDIAGVVQAVLDMHAASAGPLTLEAVNEADSWAANAAVRIVQRREES